jgi:hypothetical protein
MLFEVQLSFQKKPFLQLKLNFEEKMLFGFKGAFWG